MARATVALALCALLAVGGAQAQTYTSPADAVIKTRDLSTLLAAAYAADLVPLLENPTANLTVLAPNNAAFTKLVQQLGITPSNLLASNLPGYVLKNHVIEGAAQASALSNGQTLYSALGQPIKVEKNGDTVTFVSSTGSRANVITPNVQAGNSFVHIIDSVLVPTLGVSPAGAPASAPSYALALAAYEKGLAPAPAK